MPPTAPQNNEAEAKTWLDQFPQNRRSLIANTHCLAVRNGAKTVADVRAVARQALAMTINSPWSDEDKKADLRAAVAAMDADREGHALYCEWVLSWEALPKAERDRLKADRGAKFRQEWMAEQPPSNRQIAYLRSLGYRGPAPTSKAEASALIDRYSGGGEA